MGIGFLISDYQLANLPVIKFSPGDGVFLEGGGAKSAQFATIQP